MFQFGETSLAPHARQRDDTLRRASSSCISGGPPARRYRHVGDAAVDAVNALACDGIAMLDFGAPLETSRFIELAARLGRPIPLRSRSIQHAAEHDVVLNLGGGFELSGTSSDGATSAAPLLLHTEESRTPIDRQPRLLSLMCVSAPPHGGRTLLSPFGRVFKRLSPGQRSTLRRISYADHSASPTLLRGPATRPIFAFRDPGGTPLRWRVAPRAGLRVDATAGNRAIAALIQAMYASVHCALVWRPGLIVILDNRALFHGRTGVEQTDPTCRRHLKRIRLL